MHTPSMIDLSAAVAEGGLNEAQILDMGMSSERGTPGECVPGVLRFLVVVPEVGACIVPPAALSHFMAGETEYQAEALPEYYSGKLSGQWTIRHDRLRILLEDWNSFGELGLRLLQGFEESGTGNGREPKDGDRRPPIEYESEPRQDSSAHQPAGEHVVANADTGEPPGKMPKVGIGKLAVAAAWAIEGAQKRRATANEVMDRLREWTKDGTHSDVLRKPEGSGRAVEWTTVKGKSKKYDTEACGKTLETWMKSRP